MGRFSFRLESVLNYRKFREKKAMMHLMELRRVYQGIEKKIMQLTSEKLKVAEKCRGEGEKGVDVPLYETYRSYIDRLQMDLEKASIELKEKEAVMKTQEAVLKSETIKRKALEIHKEALFMAHKEVTAKEEQKFLDEMIISRQEVRA
jgi:flagellar export protein FliJ